MRAAKTAPLRTSQPVNPAIKTDMAISPDHVNAVQSRRFRPVPRYGTRSCYLPTGLHFRGWMAFERPATCVALQPLSAGAFFGRRLLRAQRPEWPSAHPIEFLRG